jgi:hypothetical protein
MNQSVPSGAHASVRTRRKWAGWLRRLDRAPLRHSIAYGVFCLILSSKKAIKWRRQHDAGADDWRWEMYSAYLRGAEYAGPRPRMLENLAPPLAFPLGSEKRLAAEIAATLCDEHSVVAKRAAPAVRSIIEKLLRRRHAAYSEGFASWMYAACSQYRVVVDQRDAETMDVVTRTGPASSEVHRIGLPRTRYEVHWSHLSPESSRDPKPWEAVFALTRSDNMQEANQRVRDRKNT